ncbi:MAG: hypothetical protein JO187_09100 [Acidobacteria bacterium]|nr:hypothetical protein [Acidobacteriota bacterium]
MAFVEERGPRRWAWVLFAAVLGAIVWFIVGGIGNSRRVAANEPASRMHEPQVSPAPGRNSQPQVAENHGPITDLAALLNMNQEQLVDHQARLSAAKVLQDLGSNAFFIGSGGSQRLLVVPANGAGAATAKPGQTVDVSGTIRKLPDEKEAMKQWKLSSDDGAMLRDLHVYLEATEVKISGK